MDSKIAIDNGLISQRELERRLKITPMTVHLWRKGDEKKGTPPMPCELVPSGTLKHRVFFSFDKVIDWLKLFKPRQFEKLKGTICGGDSNADSGNGKQDDLPHSVEGDSTVSPAPL